MVNLLIDASPVSLYQILSNMSTCQPTIPFLGRASGLSISNSLSSIPCSYPNLCRNFKPSSDPRFYPRLLHKPTTRVYEMGIGKWNSLKDIFTCLPFGEINFNKKCIMHSIDITSFSNLFNWYNQSTITELNNFSYTNKFIQ